MKTCVVLFPSFSVKFFRIESLDTVNPRQPFKKLGVMTCQQGKFFLLHGIKFDRGISPVRAGFSETVKRMGKHRKFFRYRSILAKMGNHA